VKGRKPMTAISSNECDSRRARCTMTTRIVVSLFTLFVGISGAVGFGMNKRLRAVEIAIGKSQVDRNYIRDKLRTIEKNVAIILTHAMKEQ